MSQITIIIAVYNVKKEYLDECINSIINQTFTDFEVIMIDDGSDTECAAYCDSCALKDDRIKIVHKKNEGVSITSNYGISIASGKYVTFVDDDDWLEPDALDKVYNCAEENDADTVICRFYSNCEDKQLASYYVGPDYKEYFNESVWKIQAQILNVFSDVEQQISLVGANWCKLYRTEMLLKHNDARFPEYLMGGEDALFTFSALEHSNKTIFINEILYHYRQNSGSFTKRMNQSMVEDEKKLLLKFKDKITLYDKWSYLQEDYNVMVCSSALDIVQGYILHPDNKMNYYNKRRVVKELLKSDLYRDKIRNINMQKYNLKKKILYAFFKLGFFDAGIAVIKVQNMIRKEKKYE